ncbi:putative transporter-3 [Coleophoma cylindrospora]|uniref:Putative transporter-3 n=1 Tax=Coleophoma cylindrospora TaxID=1849047 RepID=A0A3D8QK11_9HELO|nr:putative transporter-3 [Coleophoma cylindrospora]
MVVALPPSPEPGTQKEETAMLYPTKAEIERLGRQRPDIFKSWWAEVGFAFSLLASTLMAEYFVSGFNILLPVLSEVLDIPPESRTWPASVFSLVTGALLLPFGRLIDMYGANVVFISGMVWFAIWSLVAGFSRNAMMLIICRALQGFGPAAFLPAGIMLIGTIYRPGPRKNMVFSLYGAFAPIGFFSGIFVGGISGEILAWNWYFWIGTILLFIVSVVAFATVPSLPSDAQGSHKPKMDFWGALTIVSGLVLVIFAITDSSHAPRGWSTPYIYITFCLGVLSLAGAVYIEGWVADDPLLPFDLFQVRYMKPLVVSLFFAYGVFGIFLFYSSFYIETVLSVSPLLTTAWFAPMVAGGLILSTIGGFTLHLLPGKIVLIISSLGYLTCVLLFALIPENPNYWAYIFPSMLCATLGVDVTYSVSNVFITTSLPKHRQGLAGALINSILFLGISFFLGIADLVVAKTESLGTRGSYKAAFWFALACAAVGLILVVGFVDVGKASSDLTAEEKAGLEAELADKENPKVTDTVSQTPP